MAEMILLAERGAARYHHLRLDGSRELGVPFGGRPFTCLLWDAIGMVDDEDRARLSAALIESGCVYAVCGGVGCEAWHDALDEALSALQVEGRVPDDRHVVTTWHTGETLDAIAEFFVRTAIPSAGSVDLHLVLQIGEDGDPPNDLGRMVRRHLLAD